MRRRAKPGDVAPKSGAGSTVNLDQGSRDHITWLRNTLKRSELNVDANSSVIVRRALSIYVRHIEATLLDTAPTPEALQRESAGLWSAARGQQDALPEEELIAVPPRPYSAIAEAAAEARMEEGRRWVQEMLKGPPAGRPAHDDEGRPVNLED